MTNKPLTPLALTLIVFFASCTGLRTSDPDVIRADNIALLPTQSGPSELSQMDSLIRHLRSENQGERDDAKQGILTLADKSEQARQGVIDELIKLATAPGGSAELMASRERFLEWKEATDILGVLKATEAVDTLIQCLDCDIGVSGLGPGRYPAAIAIIRIGDEAIPKLASALAEKPTGIKFMAAQALYSIGGEKAKEILEEASRRERDRQTADMIKSLLRDWNNSGKYKP